MTQQTAPATAEANGTPDLAAPHPDAGTGTLDERLARIVGTLKVTADAKMKAGGQGGREFSYATIDQMAGAIGPLLAAERVTIAPVGIEDLVERELVRQKQSGGDAYEQIRHMTSMTVVWRVAAAGESFEARSRGKAADSEGSEKDTNQAHSFARINLYKSLFHLVTGEDPEQKGRGGSGATGTGELPTVTGEVTGTVALGTDGRIGVKFRAEEDADFEAVKQAVRDLGGRFEKEPKIWLLANDRARSAVVLGRHLGLVIAEPLASQFAAQAPTAPTTADDRPPPDPNPPGAADDGSDIPF